MTTSATAVSGLEIGEDVRARFEVAIDSLLAKLRQDPYVLAAVLYGSLSYDVVWDKSDIDLYVITQEMRPKSGGFTLLEVGVPIHACVVPRSEFVKLMQGTVQSSFLHSALIKGRLLFTRDDTLTDLWANREHFGARDREVRLLSSTMIVLWSLAKAQKWLHVKQDPHYSFFWIMKCLDSLATIELTLTGEITGREVLGPALRHNPAFFGSVYTGLIDGPKTRETIGAALTGIEAYVKERVPVLFRPIFDYLAEAEGIRSVREIAHHFGTHMNSEVPAFLCEWLADEGYITAAAVPARLTEKSRVDVEEAAYYYDGPTPK